jgi:hypothetical protein
MTMRHQDDPYYGYVDGNALAGPMAELFAADVTTATSNCANCGMTGPVAGLQVYARAPGMVARCPGCDNVMMKYVRTPDAAWLDMSGTAAMRFPLPAS